MTAESARRADFPISPLFTDRWSPRSFVPEPMPEADLMTILEAARFAPSANNTQPWRFIYARRDTPEWEIMLSVLMDGNVVWAKNASALVILYSLKTIKAADSGEEKAFRSHAFDAGAAWMSLALQAHMLGYSAHAMGGIHHDKAMSTFAVPDTYRSEVAIAIGKRGERSALPEPLQIRETPNARKPLREVAGNGMFPA